MLDSTGTPKVHVEGHRTKSAIPDSLTAIPNGIMPYSLFAAMALKEDSRSAI